ncbi:Glycosyl transferase family 2 [Algoriphagus locisalis]|uniref:Glycosyl transferase family 2 n=1 Tax=Algoriphagus locisalis TaxID=305507 RepID=A0A1I6XTT8_9BACT|nr:glycosyltransferase family A protein [Algoriphagus locisalis]SFT41848.1 Glycosyl transferase family 2 [Algoriphagus locisalis]
MDISIVIPYYKDLQNLILLLAQLENQSLPYKQWEAIVVNNDPEIPLRLSDGFSISYNLRILEETIPGSYAARNMGIANAKGEILAFTDSDCLPDRDWLKNAWNLFSQDFKKEIGILTGPVPLFFKNPKALSDAEVYEKYTGFTTESYAMAGHAITANWFSYKSVLEEFGGFDAQLKSNGDSDLSGKISQAYQVVYTDDIKVLHPARYYTRDLVHKYKRLLGGTYTRKYQENRQGFRIFFLDFLVKRYRFAIKKIFTVTPKESWAILKVCHAINQGAFKEFNNLVKGGDTKR